MEEMEPWFKYGSDGQIILDLQHEKLQKNRNIYNHLLDEERKLDKELDSLKLISKNIGLNNGVLEKDIIYYQQIGVFFGAIIIIYLFFKFIKYKTSG
jgi:hypothetical protein